MADDDMPGWAKDLIAKVNKVVPEEPPAWAKQLFERLDNASKEDAATGATGDDKKVPDDAPQWAKDLFANLKVHGDGTAEGKPTPPAKGGRGSKTAPVVPPAPTPRTDPPADPAADAGDKTAPKRRRGYWATAS